MDFPRRANAQSAASRTASLSSKHHFIKRASGNIASVVSDPLLTVSLQTRVGLAVGIVFLMTVKPDLGQSILAVVVATIIGAVSSLPAIRAQRTARSEMEGQP